MFRKCFSMEITQLLVSPKIRRKNLAFIIFALLALFLLQIYGKKDKERQYATLNRFTPSNDYLSGFLLFEFADFRFEPRIPDMYSNNLNVEKLYDGAIVFVMTDCVAYFAKMLRGVNVRYILITHNSDSSVTSDIVNLLNENVIVRVSSGDFGYVHTKHTNLIRWFAINVATQHPLLTAIPIGLPYEPVHRKEADEIDRSSKPFLNLPPFKSRRKLLYVKFTLDERNFAVRSNVKNIIERNFASRSSVDYGANESRTAYLRRLRDVKFVISPPGLGLDCYRTWEALMMGCVPIVLNTTIAPVYRDAPVMIVEQWEDVTVESLVAFEEKLHLMADDVVRTELVKADYWKKEIMRYKIA